MEQALAGQLLDSARKVSEQAEVFCLSSYETSVHFEANRLKGIMTSESADAALRVVREGKIGFSAASGLRSSLPSGPGTEDGLRRLTEMAVETSRFGKPARFQFPSPADYPEVAVFDRRVASLAAESMIELGSELVARVREHSPDIVCDVEVTKGTSSVRIVNSHGGEVDYDKSFFVIGLEGVVIRGTDMLFVGDSLDSCRLPDRTELVADKVIEQLKLAEGKATVSTRPLPVLFTPRGVATALLGSMALAFNGKMVLEGSSPLKGRLREQVFDSAFSLCDDATLDYCLGSSSCDDEGSPSRQLSLVRNGVIHAFLYDLQTAGLAGVQSTGSGRRAAGTGQIRPAPSSLVIPEGELPFEAMVGDMEEGLVVERLIGADQGNLLGGDFGGNVLLGYKVEHGEIVGRVKDTMVAGNIYQVLKQSIAVGSEARWVDGVIRCPCLWCPSLSVSAK